MKVDLTYPETNLAQLAIEVEPERVADTRQMVYRKMVGRFDVPGFRRGKAPLAILERHLGPGAFDQEVLEELLSSAYADALTETAVEPIDQPDLNIVTWEPHGLLSFVAKVTTKPQVQLGQYTGLEVPRRAVTVADEAVEQELASMRQAFSQLVEISGDEPLATGSVAVIDFAGYVGGEAFEGGTAQDYPLELGSGSFVPGFEEGLVGAKVGDELDVPVVFPEGYGGDLAGKEAVFKCKVKAHKRRELPPADDELARKAAPLMGLKAGDDFGLVDLVAAVRGRLESAAGRQVNTEYEQRVIAKVADGVTVEVPAVMVDRAVESRLSEYSEMFERNGSTMAQYLAERELSEADLRARLRPGAEELVKRDLVIEAVGRREDISASDQEVDERVATFAQTRNEQPAQIRARLGVEGLEDIRLEITRRKTVDFLVGAQVAVAEPVAAPDAETAPAPGAEIPAAPAPAVEAEAPSQTVEEKGIPQQA